MVSSCEFVNDRCKWCYSSRKEVEATTGECLFERPRPSSEAGNAQESTGERPLMGSSLEREPDCIGKSGLYFTHYESERECAAPWLKLDKFWYAHPSGNLDARICFAHRELFLARERRGGLVEAIRKAGERR